MLKKLLKYDLKYNLKFLSIFYLITIFFGITTRLFLSFQNSLILHSIGEICNIITIICIVGTLINTLMRAWLRFKNNFYGDEAYLTHSLPVSKNSLYLSKVLSSVICLFTSIIVILCTIFVTYYTKNNWLSIENMFASLKDIIDTSLIFLIIGFIFATFIQVSNTLQIGYTGLLLGHRMNNMKLGFSVIFGFITHIVLQTITVIGLLILGLFNNDIMQMFTTNTLPSPNFVTTIIVFDIAMNILLFIIEYLFNRHLLNKGVNID